MKKSVESNPELPEVNPHVKGPIWRLGGNATAVRETTIHFGRGQQNYMELLATTYNLRRDHSKPRDEKQKEDNPAFAVYGVCP